MAERNICPTLTDGKGAKVFIYGTVPSDNATGYAKGCICINSAGDAANNTLYVNIGTSAAANFDVLTIS